MTVVVVSAPSVFVQLKNLVAGKPDAPKLILLEHDDRFAVFKDEFVFYDFAKPIRLPGSSPPPLLLTSISLTVTCRYSTSERNSRQNHLRPPLPQRRLPDQGRAYGQMAVEAE